MPRVSGVIFTERQRQLGLPVQHRVPRYCDAVASTDDEPVPSWVVVIREDQLLNPKNA